MSDDLVERQQLALTNLRGFAEFAKGKLPPHISEDVRIVCELAAEALTRSSSSSELVEALELLMFAAGRLVVATDSMEQFRAEREAVSDAMTEGLSALSKTISAGGRD